MSTDAIQVVRGSAFRTLRTVVWQLPLGMCLPILGLWLFAKSSIATKIATTVVMLVLAGIGVLCVCVLSPFAVAEIDDGQLNFYFCGVKTKSFALDGSTTFDLHKFGRLEMLSISRQPVVPEGITEKELLALLIRGPARYVPNGALDKNALVDLLRSNGVPVRQAA